MRQTLEKHYGDKPVGMGGAFIIQKGKVKTHIMVKASAHVCACVCVHVRGAGGGGPRCRITQFTKRNLSA